MQKKEKPLNDPNARSLLIHGPPGVGKTTTVRILAKELNYDVLELNASDQRNKAQIESMLNDLSQLSLSIKSAINHSNKTVNLTEASAVKKTLIVMDEVDGVGGGDRGGLSALLLVVKKTKVPIVLIANDRGDRRIQTLAFHSYEVKFQAPKVEHLMPRLKMIGQREGFSLDPGDVLPLFEAAHGDIRSILNMLHLRYASANKKGLDSTRVNKDYVQTLDTFQAAKLLLSGEKMHFQRRQDLYFLDF